MAAQNHSNEDHPMFQRLTVVRLAILLSGSLLISTVSQAQDARAGQLERWFKRFPQADTNGDGKLSVEEANAFRKRMLDSRSNDRRSGGAPREFPVDPGWQTGRFPPHAVAYKSPQEIAEIFAKTGNGRAVVAYPDPKDDSLRIVGTGHSFMAPGYKTFPLIARAAGLDQPDLLTHIGGGITGSARYKWEQENGIFQFDGRPTPKLLASIANAEWDAMVWGPYYNDRPEYYLCWMDFCLKYNPDMTFFLSDAWPQLEQLPKIPEDESELTAEVFDQLNRQRYEANAPLIEELNAKHPDKVFVLPTSEAMVLAVQHYRRGDLPGVEGIHTVVGKKERSLWRDRLGHLGPGLENLEGYVFYATIYGRSPELIDSPVPFQQGDYPSPELDRVFRKIAWQAALNNPLSGIRDSNGDGVDDSRERD